MKRRLLIGIGAVTTVILFFKGLALNLGVFDRTRQADPALGWRQQLRSGPVPDAPELILLGDESTRADEVLDPSQTFAGRLDAVNAGIVDYDTYDAIELFRHEFAAKRARHVGLVVTMNDLMPRNLSAGIHALQVRFLTPKAESYLQVPLLIWRALVAPPKFTEAEQGYFLQASERARLLSQRHLELDEQTVADWGDAISDLAVLSQHRLFVIALPSAFQVRSFIGGNPYPIHQQLRRICAARDIPLLELVGPLAHSDLLPMRFPGQLTLAGHQVVATEIADHLSSIGTKSASMQGKFAAGQDKPSAVRQ